jgi:hypothetical protein
MDPQSVHPCQHQIIQLRCTDQRRTTNVDCAKAAAWFILSAKTCAKRLHGNTNGIVLLISCTWAVVFCMYVVYYLDMHAPWLCYIPEQSLTDYSLLQHTSYSSLPSKGLFLPRRSFSKVSKPRCGANRCIKFCSLDHRLTFFVCCSWE